MSLQTRALRGGLDRAAIRLLVAALALAFLHHADHALRVDHSGWPFRDVVTPFTYSLAAYPVILFALLGSRRLYWLRWGLLAAAAGFTLYAHTLVESPRMQFWMWAYNRSLDQPGIGLRNLLDICSPAFGVTAVVIGMALNVTAVTAAVAMFAQGLRLRRR